MSINYEESKLTISVFALLSTVLPVTAQQDPVLAERGISSAEPASVRLALQALIDSAEADPIKLYGLYDHALRWSKRYDEAKSLADVNPVEAREGLYRLIDEALRDDDPTKLAQLYAGAKRVADTIEQRKQLLAQEDPGLMFIAQADGHCAQCASILIGGLLGCGAFGSSPNPGLCGAAVRDFCLCDGPPSSMNPDHPCQQFY